MNQDYRHLIEGFCKLCNVDDPGRIMDGGSVVVNEVVFSLIHSENVNPAVVFIYCDFGDVPAGRAPGAYRMLLESNLYLYTGSGPAFTVSRETGRVVLADQYPLNGKCAPEDLREILVRLAAKAVEWRKTHYLQDAPRGGPGSSGRLPGLR